VRRTIREEEENEENVKLNVNKVGRALDNNCASIIDKGRIPCRLPRSCSLKCDTHNPCVGSFLSPRLHPSHRHKQSSVLVFHSKLVSNGFFPSQCQEHLQPLLVDILPAQALLYVQYLVDLSHWLISVIWSVIFILGISDNEADLPIAPSVPCSMLMSNDELLARPIHFFSGPPKIRQRK
jgi:hypothetical protein